MLELLKKYPVPVELKDVGKVKKRNLLKKKAPWLASKLTEEIFQALDDQTVVVTGTVSASQIISSLAAQLDLILLQRAEAE